MGELDRFRRCQEHLALWLRGPLTGCHFATSFSSIRPLKLDYSMTARPYATPRRVDQRKRVHRLAACTVFGIQWRWPMSRPLVGTFGEGLYEVRSAHDGNIYRVFF